MSFHGGLIGVIVAIWLFCRVQRFETLRVCDYVACTTPFGLILVRLANFANGELWGRPTDLPWGMIFPGAGDNVARHPSQLYEAVLEGLLMMAVLVYLFWRTDARLRPGRLLGTGLVIYGAARFLIEFVRQPDAGLEHLPWGLTMGQMLSAPMLVAGLYFLVRVGPAGARLQRIIVAQEALEARDAVVEGAGLEIVFLGQPVIFQRRRARAPPRRRRRSAPSRRPGRAPPRP